MIKKLFNELEKNKLIISSAESVTGGRFASTIIENEGSSKYFKGGFICYSNEFKYNVLNVRKDIEIVSLEMAKDLAINSRIISNSDISISFTGNASLNGIEKKKKGLVYIGISNKNKTSLFKFESSMSQRKEIIEDITNYGIKLIIEFIEKNY